MANLSSKVIKVAQNEVGYLEKKSNKDLNSKTKNAGSNNYTKYGKWYGANGVFWCAEFVSWCFYKAYGFDAGKSLILGYSASCETIRGNFVKKSAYHEKNPKAGDLIFFKGSRHPGANHIGIVYKVTSTHVYTVEGNTSGASGVVDNGGGVAKKCYSLSDNDILGYGRPKYDTEKKSTSVAIANPTLKKGMHGHEVEVLQKNLSKIGVTTKVDGSFGSETESNVKKFQQKYKLKIDGIYGKNTYTWMKKICK